MLANQKPLIINSSTCLDKGAPGAVIAVTHISAITASYDTSRFWAIDGCLNQKLRPLKDEDWNFNKLRNIHSRHPPTRTFSFSVKKGNVATPVIWLLPLKTLLPGHNSQGIAGLVVAACEHKQKRSSCWTSSFCVPPPPQRRKPFFLDSKILPIFSRNNQNIPCPTPRNWTATFTSSQIPDHRELILAWLLEADLEHWELKSGIF